MSKSLNISSLSVGYNNKSILKDVNISCESNQMVGVIGRNGEGKSTLLKTISGLLPSITGNFNYGDINVLNLSEKERSKLLSIVSTTQTDIGGVLVRDFIAFGRFPYTNWLGINNDKDYQEIEKAIQLCKLEKLANRNYDELSDGEKQKVNIARAIAQDTSIIVLDEPTVHLDLINKVEIFKLLQTLSKDHNKTIIISTHQIEYSLQLCDTIWLINDSKVESLTPTEIVNDDKLINLFSDDLISFDKDAISFKLK